MLEFFNNFFAGYTASQLILGAVGALIAFFPALDILQWVKRKTGWEDSLMHTAVVAFFMLLSLIMMILTGEIDPGSIEWTLDTLLAYFGVFSVIGEAAYQRFKKKK